MILVASQRSGGANLAAHLSRTDENEHVEIHELRGFSSETLRGAFQETQAISRATKCKQYLFSLSLSPPQDAFVSSSEFVSTVERIEDRLGLQGQPRAIVFHEKNGRRHAHAVWSRIDPDTMTARPLPHFKRKLQDIARDLYIEHEWAMPRGLLKRGERDPANFTHREWLQAKRHGNDPRWIKQVVQDCWTHSDGNKAFEGSLEEHGMFLARGDRRGVVLIDHTAEIHALARVLGVKTKDVRARLGDGETLRSVDDTKTLISKRMTPAVQRHVSQSREAFAQGSASLGHTKMEMTHSHRDQRSALNTSLENEWAQETRNRQARLPRGLKGLWDRLTGTYRTIKTQNESEARETKLRQDAQRQALIDAQREERRALQVKIEALRKRQALQLLELRHELGRYFKLARNTQSERSLGAERSRTRERG